MKPLDGIRILDLSRLLPGPYCTMLLADLGAEVIKIEPPGLGDYMRLVPPFIENAATGEKISAAFAIVNRNKKSVALNFRNPRGKQVLTHLLKDADVFVEGFRPGAAAKWGVGYEAIHAINPRMVYCSLSGYGQTGPYKDRAGHDLNYIALAGLLTVNGPADGVPFPPAVQIADLSGGMLAAMSILAALVGRAKSGVGQYLDTSLFDGAMSWAGVALGGTFAAGHKVERGKMQLNGGMACYNVYETQDGQFITLAAIEPHFWAAICKALNRDDLNARQLDYGAIPEMAAIFKTHTRDEWLALFGQMDACVEPVREFSEVLNDPHVKHRGLVAQVDVPGIGSIPQVGSVFVFANGPYTAPPRLGEHTREILSSAGVSHEEMDRLGQAGVIKTDAG